MAETQQDRDIAALKRARQKLEEELASERNETIRLTDELKEARLEWKEAASKAQHEADKAVQAEEASKKRTDAYNTLKDQKANAEMALQEAEGIIAEQKSEIKRLDYNLGLVSARAADEAGANVAKEKAALEKRVHQLTTELQRVQMDLEKEKENSRPASAASTTSKIARPPSRSSTAASDSQPSSQSGRFGYRSGIPAPTSSSTGIPKSTRPSSSLGSNAPARPPSSLSSNIPSLKGPVQRRTSVTGASAAPTAVNTSAASAQKLAQLESDLSDAKSHARALESSLSTAESTISTLEVSLAQAQDKLGTKSDELLRVENRLMALERSSKDEVEQLKSELEDARYEVEGMREEAKEVADESRREMDALSKEARAERKALEEELSRLRDDIARRGDERHEAEGNREELERLLEEAREEAGDLREERDELENELAYLEEQMQEVEEEVEAEKAARETAEKERDEALADLEASDNALGEIEGDNAALSARLAQLQEEKDSLVARLADAQSVPNDDSASTAAEEVAALQMTIEGLNERVIAVEAERDNVSAALSEAQQAHEAAQLRVEELTASGSSAGEQLLLVQRDLEESRSAHEALRAESSTAAESFAARAADFETRLARANDELAVHVERLEQHESSAADLSSLRQTLAEKEQELVELNTLRADKIALDELVTDLENDVDELSAALEESRAEAAELRSALDQHQADGSRAVDDEEVELLKSRLATAEQQTAELEEQLQDAQRRASDAEEELQTAEDDILVLRDQVSQLETAVETEKAHTAGARSEHAAVEEALFDARHELGVAKERIEEEARARQEVVLAMDGLRAELSEHQAELARFEGLEEEFYRTSAALDDLRAQYEDATSRAFEETAALESTVEELQRKVGEADALSRVLAATEAQLDSLGEQLQKARQDAQEKEEEVEENAKALLQRAEDAEGAADTLRSEVDDLRHQLSDARDSLDQAQSDLAASNSAPPLSPSPASPSPASPAPSTPSLSRSFTFSPEADPSILILRLREERDELRGRLDFARTEAKFRTEELQSRLRSVEESKASEVGMLRTTLLDTQAAYDVERDTNVKLEQAVREAKRQKRELDEALEGAEKKVRDAEVRVADVVAQLTSERKEREEEQGRDGAWALENDSARAELNDAKVANDELHASLAALEAELAAALSEVKTHKSLAASAGARIEQLEAEFSALKQQQEQEADRGDALAEFASLCETLRSDVDGLHAKIAARDATINQYERKIALLQLNLAVRVAIEDDEDLGEDGAETVDAAVQAAEPTSTLSQDELVALQEELDVVRAGRAELEQQLSDLQAQLDLASGVTRDIEAAHGAALADAAAHANRVEQLEGESLQAQDRLASLQDLLAAAESEQGRLSAALDAETSTSSEQRSSLVSRREQLEQSVARLGDYEDELARVTTELAGAQQAALEQREKHETGESSRAVEGAGAEEEKQVLRTRVAELESALQAADLNLTQSRKEVASLTSRLTATSDDLNATKDILEATTASLAALRDQAESSQDRQQEIAGLQQQVERLQVELDEKEIVHEQAQSRLRLVEEQLAATTVNRDAVQHALAAAEIASSSTLEEHERLIADLTAAKEDAVAALDTARTEIASLTEQLAGSGESNERTATLEAELHAAQSQVQQLEALVQSEREEATAAKAAVEEAESKAKSAAELATREIQSLRRLSKSSQGEAESLTVEVNTLRQKVDELTTHITELADSSQRELQALNDKSQQNIAEVIDALQVVENDKAALEQQVVALEEHIRGLSAASAASSNGEAEARVVELEKMLENRMVDVEEADEKLIEALKTQKRYTAQIERLKAKIATLQRDLAAAKSAPPPVPVAAVPLPSAPSAPLSNKKRRAPQEFDALPTPAPRAIVASQVPALDQENVASSRPLATPRSRGDSVVPLKPEHVTAGAVKPLQPVDENASLAPTPLAAAPAKAKLASKVDSLKARMKAQRQAREAATA
ncbi:hypothetical protein JCM8097_007861 [Rhodosporidiobolus ruineniae]